VYYYINRDTNDSGGKKPFFFQRETEVKKMEFELTLETLEDVSPKHPAIPLCSSKMSRKLLY